VADSTQTMRIVMMGTGPFAIPTFRAIHAADAIDVAALITRPPRSGRRKSSKPPPPNPMQTVGTELGLPIEMPNSINELDSIELLKRLEADLFVVCDYGQILSSEALGQARLGGINLHASLLPKYRGAAPINWAIYDGCDETGVTVIHMTRKLDAGPNLIQRSVKIGPTEDAVQLEERLADLGAEAILESIGMLATWDGTSEIGERQDPKAATKAPRLKKSDGEIDWTRSAKEISNQMRAFCPWPGTFTHWLRPDADPLRIVIKAASADSSKNSDSPPGSVVETEERLAIATGHGCLIISEIQPAGKTNQSWDAFLRGYPVSEHELFGGASQRN